MQLYTPESLVHCPHCLCVLQINGSADIGLVFEHTWELSTLLGLLADCPVLPASSEHSKRSEETTRCQVTSQTYPVTKKSLEHGSQKSRMTSKLLTPFLTPVSNISLHWAHCGKLGSCNALPVPYFWVDVVNISSDLIPEAIFFKSLWAPRAW